MKNYGILALPVILLVSLGIFDFRPGELVKGKKGYIINFLFISSYLIIAFVGVGFVIRPDHKGDTSEIFMTGFAISMIIKFSFLLFIFYKNYGIFHLLKDIKKVTRGSLSTKELIYVTLYFTVLLTIIVYNFSYMIPIVNDIFKTGTSDKWIPRTIQTDDPIGIKIIVIIEVVFYLLRGWSSLSITSSMIVMIAIVFRKEFENCVDKAKDQIIKKNTTSMDEFSEIFERFYNLNAVLQKADEIFSPIIGLNLIISLGMLCGASYGILIGEGNINDWHFPILISMITLFTLIPPLTTIHIKVNLAVISLFVLIPIGQYCVLMKTYLLTGTQHCQCFTTVSNDQIVRYHITSGWNSKQHYLNMFTSDQNKLVRLTSNLYNFRWQFFCIIYHMFLWDLQLQGYSW